MAQSDNRALSGMVLSGLGPDQAFGAVAHAADPADRITAPTRAEQLTRRTLRQAICTNISASIRDRRTEVSTQQATVQQATLTPDRIMNLGFGYWGSKTLLTAVELGLFN